MGNTMEKLVKITIFKFGKSTINGAYLIAMCILLYIYIWYIVLYLVGGIPTPLENHGVKISWDFDIPHIWKYKIHVPNHHAGLVQDAGIPLGNRPNGFALFNLLRILKFQLFRTVFFSLIFLVYHPFLDEPSLNHKKKSGKAEVNNVTPWGRGQARAFTGGIMDRSSNIRKSPNEPWRGFEWDTRHHKRWDFPGQVGLPEGQHGLLYLF